MEIVKRLSRLREITREVRRRGERIGFVPTMGGLHDGHLALVRRARDMTDCVVMSLFVNRLQFDSESDFDGYPRDSHRDAELAKDEGVAYLFLPDQAEMYPDDHRTHVEVDQLDRRLCGANRPGHFRGVATVVTKLLSLVRPQFAFFGEKDAQQLLIVRRLVRDLSLDVEIVGCPTVRESDGLALSSRNLRLSAEERAAAPVLHRALSEAEAIVAAGERDVAALIAGMRAVLAGEPLAQVDYVEVVDTTTLEPLEVVGDRALAAIAVCFRDVRLIDNTLLPAAETEES